ncbi:hypothetical protein BB561_005718, partial [Smittium simulii]
MEGIDHNEEAVQPSLDGGNLILTEINEKCTEAKASEQRTEKTHNFKEQSIVLPKHRINAIRGTGEYIRQNQKLYLKKIASSYKLKELIKNNKITDKKMIEDTSDLEEFFAESPQLNINIFEEITQNNINMENNKRNTENNLEEILSETIVQKKTSDKNKISYYSSKTNNKVQDYNQLYPSKKRARQQTNIFNYPPETNDNLDNQVLIFNTMLAAAITASTNNFNKQNQIQSIIEACNIALCKVIKNESGDIPNLNVLNVHNSQNKNITADNEQLLNNSEQLYNKGKTMNKIPLRLENTSLTSKPTYADMLYKKTNIDNNSSNNQKLKFKTATENETPSRVAKEAAYRKVNPQFSQEQKLMIVKGESPFTAIKYKLVYFKGIKPNKSSLVKSMLTQDKVDKKNIGNIDWIDNEIMEVSINADAADDLIEEISKLPEGQVVTDYSPIRMGSDGAIKGLTELRARLKWQSLD